MIYLRSIIFVLLFTCSVHAEKIKLLVPASKPHLNRNQIDTFGREASQKTVEGFTGNRSALDLFDEVSYRYTGGRYQDKEIRFRLLTPDTIDPGRKYPFIIWFHGRGESGEDNERQLAHAQNAIACLAGPDSRDFFLMATQCPGDNKDWKINVSREDGKGDAPIRIAREIMEAVIEQYPIDKDRVAVFGLSSGGTAAWQFVMESPEIFSGLCIASAIPPNGPAIVNMNIWVFCTMWDNAVPLEEVREKVDSVNAEGGSALLTKVEAEGHNSWSEALRNRKVLTWLVSQKRGAVVNIPPGFEMKRHSTLQVFLLFALPLLCLAVMVLFIEKRKPLWNNR